MGNARLSYGRDENGVLFTEDSNDYYPFGLNFINPQAKGSAQVYNPSATYKNYKYNGKELQETGAYAMDFRHYMPDIGRFVVQDGLAEVMPDWTPYRFAFNNPVYFSDPTGLSEETGNTLATCPTCPNTPQFQPLINDPNNVYVYDPQTNTAEKETQIEEVVVTGNKKDNTNGYKFQNYSFVDNILNNQHYSIGSLGLEQGIARTTSYVDKALRTRTTVNFTVLNEYAQPAYRTTLLGSALKTSKVASAAKVLKISGNALAGVGAVVSIYQYGSGQISGTEFTVDMIMTGVGFLGPVGAGVSLIYFGGKAVYEYSTGENLFEKPTQ